MKRILVLAVVAAAALVFSSATYASSLTCAHGNNCSSGNGPTGHGTLPFTGLGLAAIAAVGGLLLVTGLTLHRASRRRS